MYPKELLQRKSSGNMHDLPFVTLFAARFRSSPFSFLRGSDPSEYWRTRREYVRGSLPSPPDHPAHEQGALSAPTKADAPHHTPPFLPQIPPARYITPSDHMHFLTCPIRFALPVSPFRRGFFYALIYLHDCTHYLTAGQNTLYRKITCQEGMRWSVLQCI